MRLPVSQLVFQSAHAWGDFQSISPANKFERLVARLEGRDCRSRLGPRKPFDWLGGS